MAREIVVPSTTMAPNSEQTAADTAESIAPEVLAALDNEPDAEVPDSRVVARGPDRGLCGRDVPRCREQSRTAPGTVAGGPTD